MKKKLKNIPERKDKLSFRPGEYEKLKR